MCILNRESKNLRSLNSLISAETGEWRVKLQSLFEQWGYHGTHHVCQCFCSADCWQICRLFFKFRSRRQWAAITNLDRRIVRIAQELLGVNARRVLSSVYNFIFFSSTCLLKKHLPPLSLCHMEEVLFNFYHLKLINCQQARDASLESPLFFLHLVIKQQFCCPCKLLIGRKLKIFYKYPIHSLFIMLISSFPAQKLSQGHFRL